MDVDLIVKRPAMPVFGKGGDGVDISRWGTTVADAGEGDARRELHAYHGMLEKGQVSIGCEFRLQELDGNRVCFNGPMPEAQNIGSTDA